MTSAEHLYSRYSSTLAKCDLFSYLRKEEWLELLVHFHEERWKKKTCIINPQKFLFHFYIISSGRLKMYHIDELSSKEHTLFLLKEGDVFDLFCLLDGAKHTAYYECLDTIKVLAIPMDQLRNWLNLNPVCYKHFLSFSAKIMRFLEANVSQLIFANISTRLLKLLLDNIDKKSNKLELINDLPNKELAYLIGSTRAVVNRHLQKFKKNGSITLQRNQLAIKDASLLLEELNRQIKNKN